MRSTSSKYSILNKNQITHLIMAGADKNILGLWIYRCLPHEETKVTECQRLVFAINVASFGYFRRKIVQEYLQFSTRMVLARQHEKGHYRFATACEMDDEFAFPFICYGSIRADNLAVVIVAHDKYPERVLVSLMQQVFHRFDTESLITINKLPPGDLTNETGSSPSLSTLLTDAQIPEKVDKIILIQKQLDETTKIMRDNIDRVIARGVDLDKLMASSNDLSASSVEFYRKSKKLNCCKWFRW